MTAWQRWVNWLDHKETGETLALFRIGCGIGVVASLSSVVAFDLALALWADVADGGILESGGRTWLFEWLGGRSARDVGWVVAVTLIAGLFTTIGLGGRFAQFVTLQGFLALTRSNGASSGAQDLLLINALWLLVLSKSNATWSLDRRLASGAWSSSRRVSAWPRQLVVFQLVVMYFSSGLHKLSAFWTPIGDYSALYYVLLQPSWQRFSTPSLATIYPLTQVATAVVWCFELSAPLLLLALHFRGTRERGGRLRRLFNRFDLRVAFAAIGVPMHLAIFASMQVGAFSWIALCCYLCLWKPEEVRSICRSLAGRLRPRGSVASPA